MKSTWQVQEAKNKFSELLERAATEPQVITRHGRKAGVLISYAQYCKSFGSSRRSLRDLYAQAPKFAPGELDFTRERDTGREAPL